MDFDERDFTCMDCGTQLKYRGNLFEDALKDNYHLAIKLAYAVGWELVEPEDGLESRNQWLCGRCDARYIEV